MRITFVTRKFGNVERNSHYDVLHITPIRVARLFLDCNGDFAIKAYGIPAYISTYTSRRDDNKALQFQINLQQVSSIITTRGSIMLWTQSVHIWRETSWFPVSLPYSVGSLHPPCGSRNVAAMTSWTGTSPSWRASLQCTCANLK